MKVTGAVPGRNWGARPLELDGTPGFHFAVWAPNADHVSLVGQFNQWDGRAHPMTPVEASGIWQVFVPHLGVGEAYKFEIHPRGRPLLSEVRSLRAAVRSAAAHRLAHGPRRHLYVE